MVNLPAGQGGYVILELLLNKNVVPETHTENEYCETDFAIGEAASDDMLVLTSKESQYKKALFIIKWRAGATLWTINFFKCKLHWINDLMILNYYPSQSLMESDEHYISANFYFSNTFDLNWQKIND